ncbi:kinase-like domain-containing protein [Penicillium herquei]|nr:kinase-like domain-containing protein [Penicillium herquei]
MSISSSTDHCEPELSPTVSISSSKHLLQTPGKLGTGIGYRALEYDPGFPKIGQNLAKVAPGVVMKYPHCLWWLIDHENLKQGHEAEQFLVAKENFEKERQVFEILGDHPRIAAEAIEFIHKHRVHHFDMGPRNMLVHADSNNNLNLLLCDFGVSGIGDEKHDCCPTPGFFDREWTISPVHQDLFGLASIFYLIMTGSCPYADVMQNDTIEEWNAVLHLIRWERKFPSVDNILGSSVILDAWQRVYPDATSLIDDQDRIFDGLKVLSEAGICLKNSTMIF